MPFKDPEKQKEWKRKWDKANIDKRRKWVSNNRDKTRKIARGHYSRNKKKCLAYLKKYWDSDNGMKMRLAGTTKIDIPKDLIELKRLVLLTKREIKKHERNGRKRTS